MREGLDQIVIRDFFSERLGKLCEPLRKAQSHFPRFVFASGQECPQRVDLVLFFGEVAGHRDERFEAQDSDGVLVVLRELTKDWHDVLDHVLLVEVG